MYVHYLRKHDPKKMHLFSKHCILHCFTTKLIITWLWLNHPSLLVGYLNNPSVNVVKHAVGCGCHFFLLAIQRISAYGARSTVRLLCLTLNFLLNCCHSPKLNSNDYTTSFIESYSSENVSCKSAICQKSSSFWIELQGTFNAALKGAIFAFLCFTR